DVDGEELCNELTVLSLNVPKEASAHEVFKYLVSRRLSESYVNSTTALRFFSCSIPVTVASAEHSFSRLKLIKTFLRSTMSQFRLNDLALVSIEHDVAVSSVDFHSMINEFAALKARRVPL
ncbi:MAG: hAT transposon family protein, partial [Pseudomonadota bacterium]